MNFDHGRDECPPYHDYHEAGRAPRFPSVPRPGRRRNGSSPREALTYALVLGAILVALATVAIVTR